MRKKIYIVDDDPNIVEFLTLVLEDDGFVVQSQLDDVDACAKIAASGCDLVILDVMFPEDDSRGFSIARELRSLEQTARIPILMLSAINERHIYVGDFSNRDRDDTWLPVDEVLEKPVRPYDLLAKVRHLLMQADLGLVTQGGKQSVGLDSGVSI